MSAAATQLIRRATPSDAATVRELTRQAYAQWVPILEREPLPMTRDYERIVREDPVDLLLLDGELLALIWMVVASDHLLIESLAVQPAQQGKGYGHRLLAHAESFAATQGLSLMRLYTNRLFAANIGLYLRSGYAIDREEAFLGGVTVHMSKQIEPGQDHLGRAGRGR